ncbi:MAG: dethiobiotin synthase [Bacillota bacterium]
MAKGIFILGTDTDVGKTVVTAGLTYVLKKNGYKVCSYKAVQSGGIKEDGQLVSGDARFVKEAAGLDVNHDMINGCCLETPVSPHLAAKLEGIKLDPQQIIEKFRQLCQQYDYVIVEGSGGLIVPIVDISYTVEDLIKEIGLPVLVVGRTGVGTINHTCLTVKYAQQVGIAVKGILLNGSQGTMTEKDNETVIREITGVPLVGVIDRIEGIDVTTGHYNGLREEFEKKINPERLIQLMGQVKEGTVNG